jgi:hypothetical protein
MAVLRTYAAEVSQLGALAHWRFNEASGTTAEDRADELDGAYNGVTLGAAGTIGDGAASFDGSASWWWRPWAARSGSRCSATA